MAPASLGEMPPVTLHWYDGGLLPARPDELADYHRKQAAWEKERDRLGAPLRDHVATLVGAPSFNVANTGARL